ncbi:MAG: hypothetical protein LBS36_05215 [Oscillospiraceae bacterium]|nr:hypothetical protein [Oscillospiraceae bacterium]
MITKLKDDMVFLENNSILIRFAQEETLRLSDDEPVEWQFHWRVNNETEDVFVSEVEQQTIYRFLGGGAI